MLSRDLFKSSMPIGLLPLDAYEKDGNLIMIMEIIVERPCDRQNFIFGQRWCGDLKKVIQFKNQVGVPKVNLTDGILTITIPKYESNLILKVDQELHPKFN
ncbi:hypothetical protein CYY_004789 [Polysphondylium violaceum]|uniref:Uncharacterized protein n=1 Tax=Polysphondylium violaceum TaxID=133409 RepID=A0A8J4Q4Q6_9MYCE|nr:hypothetical protein CYY_004789 [Polysphondylium violaceum]